LDDSPNSNDRARGPAGFNIACYRNRSCHYNSIAWKTAQHFSYGARGFMRVPVSEANDLNYLLNNIFNDCELLMRRLATEALGHMLLGWRSESTFLISQMEYGVIFYQELNILSTKMQSRTVLTRQYLRWG
jgi:hypothetical protein